MRKTRIQAATTSIGDPPLVGVPRRRRRREAPNFQVPSLALLEWRLRESARSEQIERESAYAELESRSIGDFANRPVESRSIGDFANRPVESRSIGDFVERPVESHESHGWRRGIREIQHRLIATADCDRLEFHARSIHPSAIG
jgi:hypothetical protein